MEEIEVKILDIDLALITARLHNLGARKVYDGKVITTWYKHKKSVLDESQSLRIRSLEDHAELVLKEKIDLREAKIMKELQTKFGDVEQLHLILMAMGFRASGRLPKHRVSYHLGDIHYDIDTIPSIPTYLEVEAPTVERMNEGVGLIGYAPSDGLPLGTKKLLDRYEKGHLLLHYLHTTSIK